MTEKKLKYLSLTLILTAGMVVLLAACGAGPAGPQGPEGPAGPPGDPGPSLSEEQSAGLEKAIALAEAVPFPSLEGVPRGCPSCHVLVDEETGAYTLPFEAHERAEIRGGEHPHVAPDGTSLEPNEEVRVTTCLLCHAAGTGDREGMGVVAPLALRDIVHPAHMSSQWFKLHYGGNCFTCHNVNGEGEFNPASLPIPGAMIFAPDKGGQVVQGGLLYDKWWKVAGADEPTDNHPLWATQSTNTREGGDTWRCKECHGWDYKGADGAYASGSHFTGFAGVFGAENSFEDFVNALKAENHDFSAMLDEESLNALAEFLSSGLIDMSEYIDYETKAANGDSANGEGLFATTCAACHGSDGDMLNFGSDEEPEYVGQLARGNPWETLHKIQFGHPGSPMPSSIALGWSIQDAVDVLTYLQEFLNLE